MLQQDGVIELTTRSVAALGHIRRRIEYFHNELLRFGLPPRRLAGRQELLHHKFYSMSA